MATLGKIWCFRFEVGWLRQTSLSWTLDKTWRLERIGEWLPEGELFLVP
jgi:hypothetical protein